MNYGYPLRIYVINNTLQVNKIICFITVQCLTLQFADISPEHLQSHNTTGKRASQ